MKIQLRLKIRNPVCHLQSSRVHYCFKLYVMIIIFCTSQGFTGYFLLVPCLMEVYWFFVITSILLNLAGPEDAPKICYRCKKPGHLSRDCQEHQDDSLHSHANVGVEDDPLGLDKSASELDKVTIEEDDIHEIGEEEKEKLNDVDYLTGNPLPSDILLYAVPVCGPYSSVQSYKYRVKITPGSVKRGKGK